MEPGALATDLFLITCDPSGRPGLPPDLLACGLVGAQLGDLVVAGALTVDADGQVVAARAGAAEAADSASETDDEAAALVLDSVAHEGRSHPVRAWVDVLGTPMREVVRNRLVRDGVLAVEERRGLLGRRRTRITVADPTAARAPALALTGMVRQPGTFTLHGAFTLVLLAALGMERLLEPAVDSSTAGLLAGEAAGHLPVALGRLRDGIAESATALSLAVRR